MQNRGGPVSGRTRYRRIDLPADPLGVVIVDGQAPRGEGTAGAEGELDERGVQGVGRHPRDHDFGAAGAVLHEAGRCPASLGGGGEEVVAIPREGPGGDLFELARGLPGPQVPPAAVPAEDGLTQGGQGFSLRDVVVMLEREIHFRHERIGDHGLVALSRQILEQRQPTGDWVGRWTDQQPKHDRGPPSPGYDRTGPMG